ncbi:phage tail protein I [Moraxella bovoculi]|uniref:phage tail protein I n=1 Tax=Moraxella bovoculi TaxID=386891 RepID=UPI0009B9538D|nr:phage tail protein I [Moraxella bovoculi]
MNINHLLPPNSTDFEHAVTNELASSTHLDVNIDMISRIDEIRDDFLGFLAWQYSLDSWDDSWQPSLKRELIKKSFRQHQLKGTRTAVREILEKFGYEATFVEWWEVEPNLPAGSFRLELSTAGTAMSEAVYQELNRLINDAKPVSRHLTNLSITLTPKSDLYLGVAVQMGDETTIYPRETT